MPNHKCPITGCKAIVPSAMLMCPRTLALGANTTTGRVRKSKGRPLLPEVARLVAEYRARQAAAVERPVELSPLEKAWREFRANMGNVSEPGFTELP